MLNAVMLNAVMLSVVATIIMAFSIMTLRVVVVLSLRVSIMPSVVYGECCELALYAECHYAECHYAECRGIIMTFSIITLRITVALR
jgi:hypothetical protein